MTRFLSIALSVGVVLGLPALALAVPLTLTSPAPPAQQFQQTQNSPCVFGDPSCKQPAGFTLTSIAGGGSLQNFGVPTPVQSPTYTGAQFLAAIGSLGFIVGIDVNQGQQLSPNLTYFAEFINGVEVATFGVPGAGSGGSPLVLTNNGNGFADAILSGFVAPLAGDSVFFRLSYINANDGTEEFFLINTAAPPPVRTPEPATILLLGSGLVAVGAWARRKVWQQ